VSARVYNETGPLVQFFTICASAVWPCCHSLPVSGSKSSCYCLSAQSNINCRSHGLSARALALALVLAAVAVVPAGVLALVSADR
jgi:hypothetical protein